MLGRRFRGGYVGNSDAEFNLSLFVNLNLFFPFTTGGRSISTNARFIIQTFFLVRTAWWKELFFLKFPSCYLDCILSLVLLTDLSYCIVLIIIIINRLED